MTLLSTFRFAVRLCWREFKSGELNVLLLALIIAISSHTAIGFFTERLNKAMSYRARDLMGADLLIQSARSKPAGWFDEARAQGLDFSEVLLFSSVVMRGEDMLLVGVKAVDQHYPLKPGLKTSTRAYGEAVETTQGPLPGEVWVETRVLNEMDLQIGQTLTLGAVSFTVSRVLNFEPDRGSSLYSFTPRVMMNSADLPRADLIQDGSRVDYQFLFAGDETKIKTFEAWIKPQLMPGQTVMSPGEQQPTIGSALKRAQGFMGLASLLAVLLAAVAIAISARHYSVRHYDSNALLRCLGCKQNALFFISVLQLVLLAGAGSGLGIALGWLAQFVFLFLLRDLLPDVLPAPGWNVVWSGLGLGYVVLLGFSLPSVLRLRAVSPLRVLRKELDPLPLSAWGVYGGSLALVLTLMWIYTGNVVMAVSVMLGAGGVFLLTLALIGVLFYFLDNRVSSHSLVLRVGLRNVLRRKQDALVQTLAFGLTLMAMLVVLFIRTDLLRDWRESLPADVPNHFVINILPEQKALFADYLQAQHVTASSIYPMSRGRLTEINGVAVTQAVSKEAADNESLNRELNLTWSEHLGDDNKILEGTWWDKAQVPSSPEVSIEARLAKKLGIQLGDQLTFYSGEQNWAAKVKSIRSVKWESFRPNFYFVFDPRSVGHLPATYMTSFYLAPEQKPLLKAMVRTFPAITVFEMDAILAQLNAIISQVTVAIEYVLLFVLAAGFMVSVAAIQASLDQRLREGALMRTLGASGAIIKRTQWSEFAAIGFMASIVAVVGTELITALTSYYLFSMDYTPWWWAWLVVPLLSAVFIAFLGLYSSRKVLAESPMLVLREL